MAEKKLTGKQELFCQEYIKDFNGTQAAIRAGYSDKSAHDIASENLRKPDIEERIKELRHELYNRNKITVDEIIHELSEITRVDPAEIYDDNGNLMPLSRMSERARKSIKSMQYQSYTYQDGSESEKRKVVLHSKMDAFEKLMKHLGGYEKDNEQKQQNINVSTLSDETLKELSNASGDK